MLGKRKTFYFRLCNTILCVPNFSWSRNNIAKKRFASNDNALKYRTMYHVNGYAVPRKLTLGSKRTLHPLSGVEGAVTKYKYVWCDFDTYSTPVEKQGRKNTASVLSTEKDKNALFSRGRKNTEAEKCWPLARHW